MPNGRTGAVNVPRGEIESLLQDFDDQVVVSGPKRSKVTAQDVRRMLGKWSKAQVFVEGHDGDKLVAHFDKWVWVESESPLFRPLQALVLKWLGRSVQGDR